MDDPYAPPGAELAMPPPSVDPGELSPVWHTRARGGLTLVLTAKVASLCVSIVLEVVWSFWPLEAAISGEQLLLRNIPFLVLAIVTYVGLARLASLPRVRMAAFTAIAASVAAWVMAFGMPWLTVHLAAAIHGGLLTLQILMTGERVLLHVVEVIALIALVVTLVRTGKALGVRFSPLVARMLVGVILVDALVDVTHRLLRFPWFLIEEGGRALREPGALDEVIGIAGYVGWLLQPLIIVGIALLLRATKRAPSLGSPTTSSTGSLA